MVLKNSLFYILGDLFPSILAFLVVPFLTHALTTSEYGILTYISAIVLFLNAIYGLGFNTYIFKSYDIKKYQHSNFKMVNTLYWSLFTITLVLSIFLYYIFNNFKLTNNIDISSYSVCIVMIVFLTSLTIIPMSYLRILEKAKEFFYFTISFSIIEYTFIFILVITLNLGVEGKLLSRIIGYIFFVFLLLYFFRKILFKNFFDSKVTTEALKFSPSFAIGTLIFILIDVADRFILERYVSVSELGLYGVAYSIAFVLMSLNKGISKALQPHIIKTTKLNDKVQLENVLGNAKKFVNIITFTTTVIFLICIEFFIQLTFEKSYYDSIEFIIWLALVPMFYAHYNIYSSVLIANGEKRFYLKSMSLGLLVNIILNFLSIPIFGVYGAIISTILAYCTMMFFTYKEFAKYKLKIIFDTSVYYFSIILSLEIFLIYINYFNNYAIKIISIIIIVLMLFSFIYYKLNIRSKNDLANLLQ